MRNEWRWVWVCFLRLARVCVAEGSNPCQSQVNSVKCNDALPARPANLTSRIHLRVGKATSKQLQRNNSHGHSIARCGKNGSTYNGCHYGRRR